MILRCCLAELCFGLVCTGRTDSGCLTVLPCRLGQSALECRKTVAGLVRSTPTPPPTPLRPTPTPPTRLRPTYRTPVHAHPARKATRNTVTVTSAAESSADAPVMALVIQDWKYVARAPSVLDALDVFRARPAGRRLISSRTCELWIVVNLLHARSHIV